MMIDELGLSTRAWHALKRAGINTVEEVLAMEDQALLRIRGLGAGSLEEIKAAIHHTTTGGTKGMTVKINTHGGPLPEAIEQGDWIDLRAAETVEMEVGEFRKISLGVSMELPAGYEAHVAPRSSTFEKWGILMVNSLGIIDNSYRGDRDIWRFPALAMRKTTIYEGDRICQFRVMKKQETIKFQQVDCLGNNNRGGFGSTGPR